MQPWDHATYTNPCKSSYLSVELVELLHGALEGLPLLLQVGLLRLRLAGLEGLLGLLELLLGLGLK